MNTSSTTQKEQPSTTTTTTTDKQKQFNLNTIFTIVVCEQVFNVSWKSLISDGPNNFFTRHFLKAHSRIIHIDRSPDTMKLIIRHLRGYSIVAKDECQHQDLLNDAHYFGLKKLTKILKQFVYLNIGGTCFRLRWDLFDKDGPYNFFSGPLRHSLLSPHPTLGESAPISIERDPGIFKDVIRHLQGYSINIKDEQHRLQLLSDAQFYLFRNLRDKLKSSIIKEEQKEEVLLLLQDIKPNYIEIIDDTVYYKQDKKLFSLAIQLNDFNICCHKNTSPVDGDRDFNFLLENDINLNKRKDPSQQWVISNKVEVDKNIAIVSVAKEEAAEQEEASYTLLEYLIELDKNEWKKCSLHENECKIQWIGVEKAIAKVNLTDTTATLSISFEKLQIIGSRLQANMKRDFLPK